MIVIKPNCRVQFTAEDVGFILKVLGTKIDTADCLVRLLADEDTRDPILDDDALFRAILELRHCLGISAHFYFYILVRQVLRRAGIADRAVADYVAEMLAEFSRTERARCVVPGQTQPLDYFFEMLAALRKADDAARFLIRAHIGNHSLFLAGVFPDHIRFRAETRGCPDLHYYENLGRASYRAASEHRLARKYEVAEIFDTLAERFQATRRALNDLGERLFSLGDSEPPVALILKPSGPGHS